MNVYLSQWLIGTFRALKNGPTNDEVAEYIFDVIQSIAMIDLIDYAKYLEVALR